MKVDQIRTMSLFKDYNKVDSVILKAIEEDMLKNGYNISCPVVLWDKGNVVIDGHTRLQAAINVGLEEIDVCMGSFTDENDAMNVAKLAQRDRRNLPDSLFLELVIETDQRQKRGGDRKSDDFKNQNNKKVFLILDEDIVNDSKQLQQNSSDKIGSKPSYIQTAEMIGRGATPYKVQQVRIVLDSGDKELRQAILDGKKSILEAVKEIRARSTKKIKAPRRLSCKQLDKETDKLIDDCIYAGWTVSEIEQKIKDRLKQKSSQTRS